MFINIRYYGKNSGEGLLNSNNEHSTGKPQMFKVIQSLLFIKIGATNGRTKNTQAMATYKIQSRVA